MNNNLEQIIIEHGERYPMMEPQDFVKLIYHSEFGGGHMIWNEEKAKQELKEDVAKLSAEADDLPLFTYVGCGMYRMNLSRALFKMVPETTVARMFMRTGEKRRGKDSRFAEKVLMLRKCAEEHKIFVDPDEMNRYLDEYIVNGYEPVHHSDAYRAAYRPCYRLVSGLYKQYFNVIIALEQLKRTRKKHVVVAIDGPDGAGKSTLATMIRSLYDCNVFHTADFLADEEMGEYGIDIDRIKRQVIGQLGSKLPFAYDRFDHAAGTTRSMTASPKRLTVIEGMCASHPAWEKEFSLRIFLDISPEKQANRLCDKLWDGAITQKELDEQRAYFDENHIKQRADIRMIVK